MSSSIPLYPISCPSVFKSVLIAWLLSSLCAVEVMAASSDSESSGSSTDSSATVSSRRRMARYVTLVHMEMLHGLRDEWFETDEEAGKPKDKADKDKAKEVDEEKQKLEKAETQETEKKLEKAETQETEKKLEKAETQQETSKPDPEPQVASGQSSAASSGSRPTQSGPEAQVASGQSSGVSSGRARLPVTVPPRPEAAPYQPARRRGERGGRWRDYYDLYYYGPWWKKDCDSFPEVYCSGHDFFDSHVACLPGRISFMFEHNAKWGCWLTSPCHTLASQFCLESEELLLLQQLAQ